MRARGRWITLLGMWLVVINPLRADEFRDADRELNAAYQNALHSLPGDRQEAMRRAERAWIAFSDKNEAAFKTFAGNRGFGGDDVSSFTLGAIRDQRDVLRGFGQVPNIGRDATRARLEAADAEMTAVYKEVIRGAAPAEEQRLREAQRAWITWRDENARALYNGSPQGEAFLGSLRLTMNRMRELHRFVGNGEPGASRGTAASAPSTSSVPFVPSAPPPPVALTANPEQTRTAETLATESLALLERVADALPPAPIGAGEGANGSLADLPALPPDVASNLAAALARVRGLEDELREGNRRPPESLGRAGAVLGVLDHLRRGLEACRGGDCPTANTEWGSAGGQLAARKLTTPGAVTLHTRLEGWSANLVRQSGEAAPHLSRAADAAKLGRTADAIRELELAHRLYPDPAVPERIRRLRESSLGL